MNTATVILHGWSDCSEHFTQVKAFLALNGVAPVESVYYADYESREDSITFNDVVDGLQDRFCERGFIDAGGRKLVDLNVIVHSTGGLVIRHWIWRYYGRDGRMDLCPVKRIVMLAPANFGSPLAARGKSFLGSLVKGRWSIGDFLEVGRKLLDGLELGSPYQWWLAQQDLIVPKPYFNGSQILMTILVGAHDYGGIRGWVNKPGTDGVVVIAGTSLDAARLTIDFSGRDSSTAHAWDIQNPADDFAFGVLPGLDHGTIVSCIRTDVTDGDRNAQLCDLLIEALTVTPGEAFRGFQQKLENITAETYRTAGVPKFQQFIVHAVDDQGEPVADFTLEFFLFRGDRSSGKRITREELSDEEDDLSRELDDIMTGEIHTHSIDTSYRRLLVDLKEVEGFLERAKRRLGSDVVVSMRVHVPPIDDGIRYDSDMLQNIVLHRHPPAPGAAAPAFFYENTTTLVELRVDRMCEYVTVTLDPREH